MDIIKSCMCIICNTPCSFDEIKFCSTNSFFPIISNPFVICKCDFLFFDVCNKCINKYKIL
jgi:hypothetical protein